MSVDGSSGGGMHGGVAPYACVLRDAMDLHACPWPRMVCVQQSLSQRPVT